jgi:hypothetical protein
MDLRKITEADIAILDEENTPEPCIAGRRPHPSAFPSTVGEVVRLPNVVRRPKTSQVNRTQKIS